jgi:hypothetical protein|tara:strand:- start:1214 stop:1378 length:165 start_codon:yes stop_codon:yes gene_type:complete
MNVDVNSKEFKEFMRISSMSQEELEQKQLKIIEHTNRVSKAKEEEYDPKKHTDD